jgi:hypothetical protein
MPTQTSGPISIKNIYDHWAFYGAPRSNSMSFYRGSTVYNSVGVGRTLASTNLKLTDFYDSYPVNPVPPPPPPGDGDGGGGT